MGLHMRGMMVFVMALACGGCGGDSGGDADAAPPRPDAAPPDAAPDCESPEDCDDLNSCTADICNQGSCENPPEREGEPCNDRITCTEPDLCKSGVCVGEEIECSHLGDLCNEGICDEDEGGCVLAPVENGTSCDDGSFCTVDDECAGGACVSGPDRDCSAVEDQCNDSECSEDLAACVPVPLSGIDCEDGLFCTDSDQCQAGECTGGPAPDCADTDDCTSDYCDTSLDQCAHGAVAPIPNAEGPTGNPTCADGEDNDCDGAEDLDDPDCSDCGTHGECDDGLECTTNTCDGVHCQIELLTDTDCETGDYCTVNDKCAAGLCAPGDPRDCSDGDACTSDVCDAGIPGCTNPPRLIDADSAVGTSSDDGTPLSVCLVAGTNARAVIWTVLHDTLGMPLAGATVTIGGIAATEPSTAPGTYYIELAADAAPGSEVLSIVANACGDTATLNSSVAITYDAANGTLGGTGGCGAPAGGNLRVRVVDEAGAPLVGARLLVGAAEGAPFELSAEALFGGASSPGTNVAATTGPNGYVELYDYGDVLDGPFTVTAGATDHAYLTLVAVQASDIVLALPELHPPPAPTTTYDLGSVNGDIGNCDDLDVALVFPMLRLGFFSGYDLAAVFGKKRCWDSGNSSFGSVAIPENLWVAEQSLGLQCLMPGPIDEAPWSLDLANSAATGVNENVAFGHVRIPLADVISGIAGGGSLAGLLANTAYRGIGFMLNEEVPTLPTSERSVDLDSDYLDGDGGNITFAIAYVNPPESSDIIGFAVADYAGTNGTGPLFVLGHAMHEFDEAGGVVAIPASDLDGAGAPSGVGRLASVSALYVDPLDPSHDPPVAANHRAGVSTALIRGPAGGGEPFSADGGSATVVDMLDIVGGTYTAPSGFEWDNAIRNGNVPLYSRHDLSLRTRSHRVLACQDDNDVRTSHSAQWIVLRPFGLGCSGQECFTLPTLPAGFPRQGDGVQKKSGFEAIVGSGADCGSPGECEAGEDCVDPDGAGSLGSMCMGGTGTSADPHFTQDYMWRLRVYDLGLAPAGWSFHDFVFAEHADYLTHETWNWVLLE